MDNNLYINASMIDFEFPYSLIDFEVHGFTEGAASAAKPMQLDMRSKVVHHIHQKDADILRYHTP